MASDIFWLVIYIVLSFIMVNFVVDDFTRYRTYRTIMKFKNIPKRFKLECLLDITLTIVTISVTLVLMIAFVLGV